MKRLLVGLLVIALGLGGAALAKGQGEGGTLGAKAVGKATFDVTLDFKQFGLNCPKQQSVKNCMRKAKLGSVVGGNARVAQGGKKVGTAYFSNVITKTGKRGQGLFFATVVLADGTVTLQGYEHEYDSPAPESAITGGTGAYAGARGVESEGQGFEGPGKNQYTFPVTLTFIP
jgi:hypothetical protein